MKVGDLNDDELKRAIRGRLTSGDLDLLLREAGRRNLELIISYEEMREGSAAEAVAIQAVITFDTGITRDSDSGAKGQA
jgi:hypothetical protein